ncbi:hypothetical protein [Geodermatophilus sabuli]|uniref:Uncharacterized protein n=1 Tax=Geodermatophilus sabuli TaxID=1564158 RepID=A0A285ED61_9ACTN|nr:hypothetical protein [Geodermatophilus sabuli]MBB3085589.1 hypothetical protein [Geodermatophilus sabuli]SNX95991.1 hypothetical protein SAMN06893097_103160 [Geodermatophilus sabuli]
MADWVELRVHGVSGTPPDYMLGSAHTVQVAGDDRSRTFRPADALGREVRALDGHVLEAFHWGRWTSGSWMQALWLLLIPFGIVNAAQFMLPPPSTAAQRHLHALCGALLRTVGLVLTALFALADALVVADLVAWQWLAERGLPVPDRVVVVAGLVLAAALVTALSRIGAVDTGRRYRFAHAGSRDLGHGADGLAGLGDAAFFDGDPDSPALRRLHHAAGLLVVAWLGLSVAADGGTGWAAGWRWAPAVVLGLVVLVVLLVGDPERRTTARGAGAAERARTVRWTTAAARVVQLLTGAALLLALVGVAVTDVAAVGRLPGTEPAVAALVLAGTVVVTLLVLAVAALAAGTRAAARRVLSPFRRFAGGMSAAAATAVGCFLAVGSTAGLTLGVEELLDGLTATDVDVPELLQRFSYAWGLTALVFAGLALAGRLRAGRRRRAFRDRAQAAMTFGDPPSLRLPPPWVGRTGAAMQRARAKNAVPGVLAAWTALGIVLAAAILAASWSGRGAGEDPAFPVSLLTGVSSPPGGAVTGDDVVIALGQATLLGIGLVTVLLARGALRSEGARRGLNVVWDVVAFWPRSAHPFVPPPYASEVVPALVRRICWHLGVPDPLEDDGEAGPAGPASALNPAPVREVVVAAHSQGSLISLVALLWLPEQVRDRVRWVTFGSQLREQFARGFPHYVPPELLRGMAGAFRWVNLYRDTDPVAGPVTSWDHTRDGGPLSSRRLDEPATRQPDWVDPRTGRRVCGNEWRLLDPVPGDLGLQTRAVTGTGGHSGYWTDPDWALALEVACGRLPDGRRSWAPGTGDSAPRARGSAPRATAEPPGDGAGPPGDADGRPGAAGGPGRGTGGDAGQTTSV